MHYKISMILITTFDEYSDLFLNMDSHDIFLHDAHRTQKKHFFYLFAQAFTNAENNALFLIFKLCYSHTQ